MLFGTDFTKTIKGVVRTKSLFYELSYDKPDFVIFTLKDKDLEHKGRTYVSISNLYRSLVPQDPTEYTFAITVFGSWYVWEVIREAPQLKVYVARWRREADIKVKSEAIMAIAEEMKTQGRSSFTAAKQKLIDKEEQDMDRHALSLLDEEAERLGLKRIN